MALNCEASKPRLSSEQKEIRLAIEEPAFLSQLHIIIFLPL